MNMLKKLYRKKFGNKNLSEFEQQYVKLIEKITKVKTLRSTRNGNTKSLFSEEIKFKVDNVQLLRGRKIFINGVLGELAAFLKKPTHVKDFEEQGCNYWKKWAGRDGSLKLDYGNAWFDFNGYNQIAELKHNLKNDPTNRRMVITGWNPANLENLSLPCCHLLYQFYVTDNNELSMIWYQRSVDVMIGLPSDALFASVWLITIAREFNMKLGEITMKFYKCAHCGNIITKLTDSGVPTFCCGQKMDELVAGTTDAAVEKHVPVYTVEGNKVSVVVGDVIHPMAEEHWIEWIVLETKKGYQFKKLNPGEEPKACFQICEGDEVVAVYEHCNLHGLWKK